VLELSQQQQNYMLIGAFELLNARRDVLQTYQDYLSATSDYWLQYVALCKTVGGRLPDANAATGTGISIGVDALPAAAESVAPSPEVGGEHAEHSHANMQMGDAP
jgi:outer membrane protein, heavy metal efflux system